MSMKPPYEILNRPAKKVMRMVERRQEQHELEMKRGDPDQAIPLHTKSSLAHEYKRTLRKKKGPRRKRSRGASYQFISRIVNLLEEEKYIARLPSKDAERRKVIYLILGSKIEKKWIPKWRESKTVIIRPKNKGNSVVRKSPSPQASV